MSLDRRSFSTLAMFAAGAACLYPSVANGRGTYQPRDSSTTAKVDDALNQIQANFGARSLNHPRIRSNGADRKRFNENVAHVVDFLNQGNAGLGYNSAYRNHYINHWRREQWIEEEHILDCACCYLILSKLVRQTVFEQTFVTEFSRQYRFSWVYDVTWSDGYINRYHVNNNVRMQVHETSSVLEHGTIFYEDGRPVILDNHGVIARQVQSVKSNWTPYGVPA